MKITKGKIILLVVVAYFAVFAVININKEKMDHYSIFSALCKKYGRPNSVSPDKTLWENDDYSMSLERPLTLKYIDKNIFNQLQQKSLVNPSGSEITREMFLEGL